MFPVQPPSRKIRTPAPPGPPSRSRATAAPTGALPQRLRLDDPEGLSQLRRSLQQQAERQRQQRSRAVAEAAERRSRADQERQLLRDELADVVPIAPHGRHVYRPERPLPLAVQHEADEYEALMSSLSDEIDVEQMLETDDSLSFRRPSVGHDVLRKLRRGQWVARDQLDLHGMRTDEAREAIGPFLWVAQRRGHRCVRIIHGKGLGSYRREPVLKGKVIRWLAQRHEVLAFCQAPPHAGGAGALLVLVRSLST